MGYEMAQGQPEGRWQQLLVKLVPSGAVADPEIVVRELDASGLQPTWAQLRQGFHAAHQILESQKIR